jgi:hypothetical protein
MNFPVQNPNSVIPKAYNSDVLEGNWYEERCISDYDKIKKKDYMLPNANSWQYDKTYDELGVNWKDFPKTVQRFSDSNDNYINFQGKSNNMYITTNKNAFDDKYRESFRQPIKVTDYYKGKRSELKNYQDTWTKRDHSFATTYKSDILTKTGKQLTK